MSAISRNICWLPCITPRPPLTARRQSALSGAGPFSALSVPFPRRSHRTSPGYSVSYLPSWYLASFRIRVWDVPNKHFSGLGGGFPKAKNRKRVLACCACYRFLPSLSPSTNTTITNSINGLVGDVFLAFLRICVQEKRKAERVYFPFNLSLFYLF